MKERFYVAEILILIKVWKMHGYDDVYGAFMAILGHTSNKEDEGQPVAVGWETGAATQMVSSPFPAAAKQRCSHRRRPKEHRTGAVSSKWTVKHEMSERCGTCLFTFQEEVSEDAMSS